MRNYMKAIMTISILTVVIVLFAEVSAIGLNRKIEAFLDPTVKILVNGAEYTNKDKNGNVLETIAYNGYNYLPVKSIADIADMDIEWNDKNRTVVLSTRNNNFKLLKATKVQNSLDVGEYGRAILKGNPTTGYTWHYTVENNDIIKLNDENDIRDSNMIGAGNTYTWNFKALKAGQTKIIFRYYRDWEGEASTTTENTIEYLICVNLLNSSQDPSGSELKNSFLDSGEGHTFQAASWQFAKACLSGDTGTMKLWLIDPEGKDIDYSNGKMFDDVTFLTLKLNPNDISEDSIKAEYEFGLKDKDTLRYLYLEMKKVGNKWKVEHYGLEQ